jgi:FtsH-binding integral membrane protein
MWLLLPIFFGMIGGIIAYIIIRKDDPRRAKNCIYVGIIMVILGIILNIMLASEISTIHPSFNVNL